MTVPEMLAKAVLQAQERVAAIITQTREELIARRDELRRAEQLPVDAVVLEQQRLELVNELETLSDETRNLEARCLELKEVLRRRVDTAWLYLSERRRSQAEKMYRYRATQDFQNAVTEYSSELERSGLDVQQATPAQLRERLPLLRMMAEEIKASARMKAESVSQKLAEAPHLQQKRLELEERQLNFKYELQQILTRLRSHSRSTEHVQLVQDILIAKEGILKRLCQEILEPLLNDARLEREKGLIGADPLEQLSDVHRNLNT